MKDKRYKEIMQKLGMPNSQTLLSALQQVANETAQEIKKENESSKGVIMDILNIIESKNPEDITQKELTEFQALIEKTMRRVDMLQRLNRQMTGKDFIPPIRLG